MCIFFRRGHFVVESALILALLTWLFIGIVEISSVWRVKSVMLEAVHDGAVFASNEPHLSGEAPTVHAFVQRQVRSSGVGLDGYTLGVTWEPDSNQPLEFGMPVTVSMTHLHQPAIIGFVPGLQQFTLKAQSTANYQSAGSGG